MKYLALAFALLLCGCTKPESISPDTLIVALGTQPATLDPRFATDAYGMRIDTLIFESLVGLGPNLEPIPEAALKWSYDHHVFTFELRPDIKFSNGRPLEVEDLEFTFEQYLRKDGPFASMLEIIKSVRAAQENGRLKVFITLNYFSDKFLSTDLTTIKILPKREILNSKDDFTKLLVGTGPFRFVKQSASEIELEGVRSASRHLIFKIIRDDFTRYQKILKGEVDIAQGEINPDKVAEFQKRKNEFNVFILPGLSMGYILVNFNDPVLKQLAVRQALSESIQREDIIRYKQAGLGQVATSILTPRNPYFDKDLKNLKFDLEQARATIKGLGLEGKKIVLKTSNVPQSVDNGKVLAYQMSQTGLNVAPQSYEWGTFYTDVKQGNFQLATLRWVGVIDPQIYRLAFHSQEVPPGRNRGSYLNPDLDHLLEKGTSEEDHEKRREIFNRVQEIVQNDIAIIPLWYEQQIAIAKRSVLNYSPDQTGTFNSLVEAKKSP